MEKKYINDFRGAVASITDETTTDPLHITFDTLWVENPDQRWPDGFQRLTFWFAARVDFNSLPDNPPGSPLDLSARWVPLQDALAAIEGDEPGSTVLAIFKQLWENSKRPSDQRGSMLE